ncbi:hypothetical protein MAR_015137 [Mya arenaria]|uniref:Uncharacterized protein n=1 Tax=Mya arenaria TaxID=6604 RepID=A0ABY7FG60_MYAAR|nr:hypothetical protein MAR_015137 [Mya arenaria]
MKDQMGDMTSTIDLSAFSILTPDMETALTDLRDSGLGDIDFAAINSTAAINATLLTAEEADDQLQNNITGVLTDVYNEIGLCLPIWNVYDSFVSIVCNYMVESLNAFWDEDPLDEDIDDFSLRYDSMQKQNRVAPDPEFMD